MLPLFPAPLPHTQALLTGTASTALPPTLEPASPLPATTAPRSPPPPNVAEARHHTLVQQLQLGLLYSVAHTTDAAAIETAETQFFPGNGDQRPAFTWKDYSPAAFCMLRSMFGMDACDYALSLAGPDALRTTPSPGKSGSVFFLSRDDRFLIKTVTREEMRLLLRLVPRYVDHVAQHRQTLLTRFFGVHRVRQVGGKSTRFVVMGNVFPSDVRLHRKVCIDGFLVGCIHAAVVECL